MPADDDRREKDKELEDDGPIEVLDDDDIAVLKSYVCIWFTTHKPFFLHSLCYDCSVSQLWNKCDSRADRIRRRSTTQRRM